MVLPKDMLLARGLRTIDIHLPAALLTALGRATVTTWWTLLVAAAVAAWLAVATGLTPVSTASREASATVAAVVSAAIATATSTEPTAGVAAWQVLD